MKEIAELLGINTDIKNEDILMDLIKEQLKQVPYVPFPTAFHTVDIIATKPSGLKTEVLLGRKHNSTSWVFIGGFVDPAESAETAALREFKEEALVEIHDESRLKYVGSSFVDDKRFKDCHKITTSIFTIRLQNHEIDKVRGGDDIAEVKWFNLEDVYANISEHHKPIFVKYLISKK